MNENNEIGKTVENDLQQRFITFINNCLIKYIGGKYFYDAVDLELRTNLIYIESIIEKVLANEKFGFIVVSDNFGVKFYKYVIATKKPII